MSGSRIVEVVSLADAGPGSLREALAAKVPRLIVFAVSGTIRLSSDLVIEHGRVTLAGETAPGPVALYGAGIKVRASDVSISHIAVYAGATADSKVAESRDSLTVYGSPSRGNRISDVVIRHMTLAWGIDENLGLQGLVDGVRIERSLLAEPLMQGGHPKGIHSMNMLLGNTVGRVEVLGSVFVAGNQRNPRLTQGNRVSFINNIIVNPGRASSHIDSSKEVLSAGAIDMISNVYLPGADTLCRQPFIAVDRRFFEREPQTPVHLADNITAGARAECGRLPAAEQPERLAVRPAHTIAHWAVQPAQTLFPRQLGFAGASPARRNPNDARIMANVAAGSARLLSNEQAIGGYIDWPEKRHTLTPPIAEAVRTASDLARLTAWLCGHAKAASGGLACPY
ncbi:MAG: hypothetical protein ACRCTD_16875 [Beijerinckiaceae bacterium]